MVAIVECADMLSRGEQAVLSVIEARKKRRAPKRHSMTIRDRQESGPEDMLPDLAFGVGRLRYASWTMKNQKLLFNFVEPMVFHGQRLKHLNSETLMQCIEAGFRLRLFGRVLDSVGVRSLRLLFVSLKARYIRLGSRLANVTFHRNTVDWLVHGHFASLIVKMSTTL